MNVFAIATYLCECLWAWTGESQIFESTDIMLSQCPFQKVARMFPASGSIGSLGQYLALCNVLGLEIHVKFMQEHAQFFNLNCRLFDLYWG